jgi:hypothetical protein
MEAVATGLTITVLAPLFFGSVALIHELRGRRQDVGRSILIAAVIWSFLVLGTVFLVTLLVIPMRAP